MSGNLTNLLYVTSHHAYNWRIVHAVPSLGPAEIPGHSPLPSGFSGPRKSQDRQRIRVLVAEDVADTPHMDERYLALHGGRATTAADGAASLRARQRHRRDCS